MPVIIAYVAVVFIWSTTPLGIHWSNSSLSFVTAVTLRMWLALGLCLIILALMRKPLVQHTSDWKVFAVGALGLFPNMLIVYWSAQFIPSGLMAVMLGITPFFVGLFSRLLLKEKVLTLRRVLALLLALLGLGIIHQDQLAMGPQAVWGLAGMLLSACLFGLSGVWLKAIGGGVEPFRQGAGVLLLAVPGFTLAWWFLDGTLPTDLDAKSMAGAAYLVVAGSVVGNTLYFFVLRHCAVDRVALITLITPVIALALGQLAAGENISAASAMGAGLILAALAVYQALGRAQIRRLYQYFAVAGRVLWRVLWRPARTPVTAKTRRSAFDVSPRL